jgi:hypothetical protein
MFLSEMSSYKQEAELTRQGKWLRKKKNQPNHVQLEKNAEIPETATLCIENDSHHSRDNSQQKELDATPQNSTFTIQQENVNYGERDAPFSLREELASWAVSYNVNRNAVTALLHVLNAHIRDDSLPLDSRTLLHTPRHVDIHQLSPGKVVHTGLRRSLTKMCEQLENVPDILRLDVNVDGAPAFKDSYQNGVFWPVLCAIQNIPSSVFAVSIYGGNKKPDDMALLLRPFVDEFEEIKNSFTFNGKLVRLEIGNIILDAPARSAVCGIMGHAGNYF